MSNLAVVLGCLKDGGLTAKPSKCVWGKTKLEYLGHMIGEGLMAIPEARVQYVRNFCRPVTSNEFRSYLGLMGYYRKFIPGFATI